MFRKELDNLLSISLQKQPELVTSENIEQGVWDKIHAIKKDQTIVWYEKMLQAMSVWQFQVSSLAFSLVLGLIIGISTPSVTNLSNNSKIGLQAFASNSPYLLSTKLVKNYEETLH